MAGVAPEHAALRRRERYWPCVLRVLAELPVPQLQSALLLLHDVGLQYAPDADPQALLTRLQDWPLLDLPASLLAEWAAGDLQDTTEESLFVATTLSFLAQVTENSVNSPDSVLQGADLACALRERAAAVWRELFPSPSPFWQHDQMQSVATESSGSLGGLPLVAVALRCERAEAIPRLLRYAAATERVLAALDELARLGQDLHNDDSNTLVAYLRRLGGGRSGPVDVPLAVGTLLLSGKLSQMLDQQQGVITTARLEAQALQSPALSSYCDALQSLVAQVARQVGLPHIARTAGPEDRRLDVFFKLGTDPLAHAIASAEASLLADPSFREAWDYCRRPGHRFGTVLARAFPISLVIDILGHYGHVMRDTADELLAILEASAYRYYADRSEAIAPDADDLALALRIVRLASDPVAHRKNLQRPLRWMREHQQPDGQIPVWFRRHDAPPLLAEGVVLYGSNCAAVESNLLLSLIEFDWDGFAPLIIASASNWCRRWQSMGLAACEHYTPFYSLWAALELIRALRPQPIPDALQRALAEVEQRVCRQLRREAGGNAPSPQNAAFMTLASLRCNAMPLDTRWISAMIKAQRPDGAWEGEGIYIVPNGRSLTTHWFKSRTITTALIYHALCQYRASREQE
jgi:hypothetical protein